jgi:DNA-binding response OmpR family regulator
MQTSLSSQQIETGPQILVVGDDQETHNLLHFFLTQGGYRVVNASSAEALRAYQAHEIDLVLLNVMMAPGDGFSFCQQLRRYSDVPLILLSAVDQPEEIVRGLELGADDAIYYPFAMVELMARMQALLRRQQWTCTHGFRLAGKKANESESISKPIWGRDPLSWNKSAFASSMQG